MSDAPVPPAPPVPPAAPPVARASRLRDLYDYDDEDDRPRRRRYEAPKSQGVLPRRQVRFMCFVVLTVSLIAAGVLCILAVWEAAESAVAWKSITTLGIVAAIMAGFTVLNEVFGMRAETDEE